MLAGSELQVHAAIDHGRQVARRGAAVIEARGLSSAASAANAVVDTVRSLTTPTPAGDWTSVAIANSSPRSTKVSRAASSCPEGVGEFTSPVSLYIERT